jgi:repressor LexA
MGKVYKTKADGSIFKELRKKTNMTQTKAAKFLGVEFSAVSKWERGQTLPDQSILPRIADLYNTTVDYLLTGKEKEIPNIFPVGRQIKIPVLGYIRAGSPILAEEHIDGYELADAKYAGDYFYLKVTGSSMEPRIPEGSLVLAKKQNVADCGQIVVCLVDGENATIKRYKPQPNGLILLQADNPTADSYTLRPEDFETGYAKILGVAVEIKIKL